MRDFKMNPQYMPQQFGGPPQNLNSSRMPPTGGQQEQGFHNVMLGPQKTQLQNGPPQIGTTLSNMSATTQSMSFSPGANFQGFNRGQIPPNQIPPSQIPPGQLPPNQLPPNQRPSSASGNQFKPPVTSKQNDLATLPVNAAGEPSAQIHNGPLQMNGPSSQQSQSTNPFGQPPLSSSNPFSQSPLSAQPPPGLNSVPPAITPTQVTQSKQGYSSIHSLPKPPQFNSQSSEQSKLTPQEQERPSSVNHQPDMNKSQIPPVSQAFTQSQNTAPGQNQGPFPPRSQQSSFPGQNDPAPLSSQHPPLYGPPSNQNQQSFLNQAPMAGPKSAMGLASGDRPPISNQTQSSFIPQNQPPVSGMTFSGQSQPFPGQNQSFPGQNQTFPGQNQTFPGQSQPFPGQSQPPSGQNQVFSGQNPVQSGQTKTTMGIPNQFQNSGVGQPPLPGGPPQTFAPSSQPGFPGGINAHTSGVAGQRPPPVSNPNQFTGQGLNSRRMYPGQQQQQNQFSPGMPPTPASQQALNQQQPHPPLPGGQPPSQYGQLTTQMQNVSLNSQRAYPGGPMKSTINDNGPHMPPPLSQQPPGGYPNGQQYRGPQSPGAYPSQVPPVGYPQGAYPQGGYPPQQQQKKLDPDQMPSPIQVTQEDQKNRSGIFCTNQKGLVPPLVTTNFIVQDQGNTSPRFIRSTMYNVPVSNDIMKQTAVPFSLVISPMARTLDQEYPPPIVNFGDLGPVRCIRCKAYMCPFMQFVDAGRRFQCLFCKATTDVPQEYFQHLDHTGQRIDRYERPELVLGTYEMVATADYCRNNVLPKPPAMVFLIDVSYNSVKSGLVHLLCAQMKEIIKHLPVDQGHEKSNMRVGFITYNSSVHFYNIKGTLAAPQMMVVGDVHEMFMPLLDGFLCTPEESGAVLDALMQQIPTMFADTKETETVLLPAILAGLEALKASDCTGKLLVFHSTLPSADAPGRLKNRDDRKLLGTDKERTILTPQTQAYNNLGQDCVAKGCSVDLFVFNNSYIDLATIGQVCRLTGGEIFKYTYFQADIDGERFIRDLIMDINRPIAFDAIMRVRTSTGVRPTEFYGHFYMSNTTDMELASVDCDKAVAVEIKHDDKLSEEEGVYVQAALLFTSCSGQRRLRIMNLSLKSCSQMADLYRNCDLDTIINYLAKQAVYKLYDHNPKAVKDNIVNRAAQMLATYRKHCASPSSAGQLILPECMKLLPLYVNCLLKSDALSGGSDMTVDERSFVMHAVLTMDVPASLGYFYTRLIPLHEVDVSAEPVVIPPPVRSTIEKMTEQGVYLLENGIHMFLWIGLGASPEFCQKVFNVQSAIQVDIEKSSLPVLDNPLSVAIRNIIDQIRIQRHRYMRLTLVRQREKLEPVFKHFLVEDRGVDGSASYVDFLCHMHKEIRALLS